MPSKIYNQATLSYCLLNMCVANNASGMDWSEPLLCTSLTETVSIQKCMKGPLPFHIAYVQPQMLFYTWKCPAKVNHQRPSLTAYMNSPAEISREHALHCFPFDLSSLATPAERFRNLQRKRFRTLAYRKVCSSSMARLLEKKCMPA